jgi:hypothetical protein
MAEREQTDTLIGFFDDRATAEAAIPRLQGVGEPRLGVGREVGGGYPLTLAGVPRERREEAHAMLTEAGASRVEAGAGGSDRAPRPVQPGFTDAPPGIVPEAADFPAEEQEGAGGRFAKQLDEAPPEPERKDR